MNKPNSYLNQQDLLDHAKNPLNYGMYDTCDFMSGEHNPSCGDSVVLCGMVKDDILHDVRFEGKGCILSLAMASKLTEYVKGLNLDEIMRLDEDIVSILLNMELGPNRLQCGMLSVVALKKGIQMYQESEK